MLFDVGHPIRRGCLASIILLVAGSCGSSGVPEEPQPGNGTSTAMEAPMTFRASGTASESRGTTEEALGNNFAVAAWKTNASGATEMVMSKDDKGNTPYLVNFGSGKGWHYADLTNQYMKYWDLSAQDYTFYAIANYEEIQGAYPTATFLGGYASIKGISGHIVTPAIDILESYYRRVASPLADYDLLKSETDVCNPPKANGATPAMADIVPLVFHRLMSEVHFKIYNSDKTEIPISKISVDIEGRGLYGKADYTAPDIFSYPEESSNLITSYYSNEAVTGLSISGNKDDPTELFYFTELPQALMQEVSVQIETPQGVFFGTFPLGNAQNGRKWEKNTVYTYTLVITTGSEIILVNIAVDDWEEYEDKNDVTHTNW